MKAQQVITIFLSVLLIAGCSTTTINSVDGNYKLSKEEKDALGNGIVQFFSGDLPNYAYDATVIISADIESTKSFIVESINHYGEVAINNNNKIVGRVGSGSLDMNPAGIIVGLESVDNGTRLSIRAVAKEGMVKQNTSGKAVERLITDIAKLSKQKVERLQSKN